MLDLTILFRRDRNAKTYAAGKPIFCQGDNSTEMYVVLEGQVAIQLGEQLLETIEPGGLFGEMALIDPAPRSADAFALTDCRLVPVSENQFQVVVQQTPYFAVQVMRILADRLRRQTQPPEDGPGAD